MRLHNRCARSRWPRIPGPVDEFGIIQRYFSRDQDADGLVAGVGDDGAVIEPTPGLHQVQVIDTLVEGIHFPSNMPAADLGYRAVAVNLSDIASMGARPRWMTLALTLWDKDESWIEAFAAGLYEAAGEHEVALIGGEARNAAGVGEVEGERARSGLRDQQAGSSRCAPAEEAR